MAYSFYDPAFHDRAIEPDTFMPILIDKRNGNSYTLEGKLVAAPKADKVEEVPRYGRRHYGNGDIKYQEFYYTSDRLKQLDLSLWDGGIEINTMQLGTNGWEARFRQNWWSNHCHLIFIPPTKWAQKHQCISFKWSPAFRRRYKNGDEVFADLGWISGAQTNINIRATMATVDNAIDKFGEMAILEAINRRARGRVRPEFLAPTEAVEAPVEDIIPGVNAWLPEHRIQEGE